MEYIQADIWVRFKRMQGHEVHFVCADDAHGAAIMLKADAEGITPQELVAKIAATRKKHLDGFHISFDHWHSTDSPENVELSQDIYRRLRDRAPSLITTKPVEQFYDPVKAMFLPDRYIKGECPKCGAKDQYADACESCGTFNAPTDLKNPYSTVSGATPVRKSSDHFFFRLSDPACVAFLREWTQTPGRLQPEVANKALEWLGDDAGEGKGLADWDISRDAPYFGIEIPDAPGKYFYVWLDAPIGYLASLKAHLRQERHRFRYVPAEPRRRSVSLHRQGHRLLPHAVLAGDAQVRRRAVQGAGQRVRPRLHHGVRREDVEVARHRRQPRRLPRPRARSRVAALLHRGEAQRESRGHRFQSRRLHRAGQQRPDRQVRQHREPGGDVHHAGISTASSRRRAPRRRHIAAAGRLDDDRLGVRKRRSPRPTRRANSARCCAR